MDAEEERKRSMSWAGVEVEDEMRRSGAGSGPNEVEGCEERKREKTEWI